jgi:hypothetical protein
MATKYGVPFAIWFGSILCGASLLAAFGLAVLDKIAEKRKQDKLSIQEKEAEKNEEQIRIWDVKNFPGSLWLIYAIVVSFYVSVFIYITIGT